MYSPLLIFGFIVVINLSLTGAYPEWNQIQYLSNDDVPYYGNNINTRSHYIFDPNYNNFYREFTSPENESQELDTNRADSQWQRSNVAAPTTPSASIPRQPEPTVVANTWQNRYEYVSSPTTKRSQQQESNRADSSWQTLNVPTPTSSHLQQQEPNRADSQWQRSNVAAPTTPSASIPRQPEPTVVANTWQNRYEYVSSPTTNRPQQPELKRNDSSWQTNTVATPTSLECQPSSSSEISNQLLAISQELQQIADELSQEIQKIQYYEPMQMPYLYHGYV